MRKIFYLISFLLISCTAIQAQHIFKSVKTSKYENKEWGRWVHCSDDIRIKNMAGTWGAGTYKIEFFGYNQSQPSEYFLVEFSKVIDGWYTWTVSDCSESFYNAMLNGIDIDIRSNEKLSQMAKGIKGTLNIFFEKSSQVTGTGYTLRD